MIDTTIFFDLIEANDLVGVKKLINDGFNINVLDKFGFGALHIACGLKPMETMAELLINGGINPNLQDKDDKATPLHYVSVFGHIRLAELLLQNKADLSVQDKYGNQPLWTATFNDKGFSRRFDMIKLFLDHGANPDHKNNVGKSPRDIIAIAGYKNLEPLFK